MNITIKLKGTLPRYWDGIKEKTVEVADGSTAEEALRSVGIDWKEIPSFGFVAINSKRVMIYDQLAEGDELKAYSKVSGG